MKKILAPIDSSESSKLAVEYAKDLAKQFDSELVLLHVVDTDVLLPVLGGWTGSSVSGSGVPAPAPAPASAISLEKFRESANETADKVLSSAQASCSTIGDKVTIVKLEGRPADQIIEYIEANPDIDLVIMGSHGMSGIKRFLIGSVTHRVTVSIDRPVLIVR